MNKLLFVLFISIGLPISLLAQKTIKGTVTDDVGELVPNATVLQVGGEKKGVQSDKDGKFSMTVKQSGTVTLSVSSVGYQSKLIRVTDNEPVVVALEKMISTQDEVVVVGYQTIKRKDLTGSVSSVGSAQLSKTPINSSAEALAGRVAGLQVLSSEGSPDAEVKLTMRGGGSVNFDNSPLYIIDGIQVENGLNNIAPQDIETIDLLKDASATAIYGARGANGVVIITTKGGKEGKTSISYNGLVGFKKIPNTLSVLDPYDFVKQLYDISRSPNFARGLASDGSLIDSTRSDGFDSKYGAYANLEGYKDSAMVNWQEEALGRTAMMQTHNVSVSGGTKSTSFRMSYGYNKEEGILLNSDFERHLVNVKIDHRANSKVKVGVGARYNDQIVLGQGTSDDGSASLNRLRQLIKYRPFAGPGIGTFDPEQTDETDVGNGLSLINPLALINAEYRKRNQRTFNVNGYVQYSIRKNLEFKSTIGYERQNRLDNLFYDSISSLSRNQFNAKPLVDIIDRNAVSLNNSNVLTWTVKRYKKKHDIIVIAGQETYRVDSLGSTVRYKNFPNFITAEKALNQLNFGLLEAPAYPINLNKKFTLLSYFGKLNYSFKDKYLATVSYRADGSSKFYKDNRWGYFPAASFAWRVSKEKFMENVRGISDLKFRLGYGEAGNNRISDYLYFSYFGANGSNLSYFINNQPQTGVAYADLSNQNLKWETTISRNLGVDMSLWNGKVNISIDAYKNSTKDLLLLVPIDPSLGFASQLQNVGETSNRGIELQITATPVRTKNFSWSLNFNNSWNKSRVEKLAGLNDTIRYYNSGYYNQIGEDYVIKVGSPIGLMYGYVNDGMYKVSDFNFDPLTQKYTLKTKADGVFDAAGVLGTGVIQPGTVKFKDLNGDSVITRADRQVIGNAQPIFFGGLNQQFQYKNFDLNIFVNWSVGQDVLNANKLEFTNGYTPDANALSIVKGRWRNTDDNGVVITNPDDLAALNANATMWKPINGDQGWYPMSWAVEDASFLRINNISLGYRLPKTILSKLRISSLRFYATVTNLAVFTNYSGYDPEVNTRRRSGVTPNVDYSAYPRSRSVVFGVNLDF